MKFLGLVVVALALAVAHAEKPYVVPIYRVIMTDPNASTVSTTTVTAATTTDTAATTTDTAATTTDTAATTTDTAGTTTTLASSSAAAPSRLFTPRGMPNHVFEHVCSGTLVDNSAIITSVTCINLALYGANMNAYVGTALDMTSTDADGKALYEVTKVFKHPNYTEATNMNNIAVLKLAKLIEFSNADKLQHITWSLKKPALVDNCVTSFWNAATPFEQVNNDVVVSACLSPVKAGTICSNYPGTPATLCPAGANGGSLVCNDTIAGVFSAQNNAACGSLWMYEEVSKDANWIWESVNAAPILNMSFAAIFALVAAMLKNL